MKELIKQYYRLFIHSEAQKYSIASLNNSEVKYPHQYIYQGDEVIGYKYLTESDLVASIKGDKSLGLILCQDKTSLAKSGCIDIDIPRDAKDLSEALTIAQNIVKKGSELGVNLYIEFSGNRGFHIWLFAEKAITHKPIKNALEVIALKANFTPKEIYPKEINSNIKLPCTIHLKTSLRCGFIGSNFDVNNPEIDLSSQGDLMVKFDVTALDKLINISSELESLEKTRNSNNSKDSGSNFNNSKDSGSNFNNSKDSRSEDKSFNEPRSKEEIEDKLNLLGDHPSCIKFLMSNGAPLGVDYNQANLSLIRYCLTRGFNLEESLKLAESMAKNTSEAHSTSKDYRGKVENFKSAFNSASRNSDNYKFECSYILSGYKKGNKGKLADRGCIGSKCSLFKISDTKPNQSHNSNNFNNQNSGKSNNSSNFQNSGNYDNSQNFNNISTNKVSGKNGTISDNEDNFSKRGKEADYYPLAQWIFEAMITLANEDREICKSNLLREIEPKLNEDNKVRGTDSESEKLIESEVLAYLIQKGNISDYFDIVPQGFNTSTDKTLLEYLDYLLSLSLPNKDTIEAHIDLIREKGIKSLAMDNFSKHQSSLLSEADSIDILSKSIEDTESLMKKSLADNNLLCASEKIPNWVKNLFDEDNISIPTFSNDLNYFLNGGLAKGRLYVIGAPPANGKSTISAQIADLASIQGFKVGYASYEMSADQLFSCSLSRLGGINSSLIEGKKYLKDVKLTEKLIETIEQYQSQIGNNIHLIEADDLYTPNRLLAIVKKLNLDLLIVDYLQLLSSGDEKLDSSYQETLKVSKIATELKRISRKANIPIIAISDISKDAYTKAMKDGDLDMSALRDSFKIAHSADCVMLLLSEDTSKTVKEDDKKVEKKATQLYVLAEKMREKSISLGQKIEMLAHEFKLDKETADTYSRLKIAKNRTGKCGDVLFRYSKALHYFEPLNYLIDNVTIYDDL